MTDARIFNTIRSSLKRLTFVQELIVLAGVIVFFIGLAVTPAVPKLLAFILSGSALAYIVLSLWQRSVLPDLGGESEPELITTMADMKGPSWGGYGSELSQATGEQPALVGTPGFRPASAEYEFRLSDFLDTHEDALLNDVGPKSEFSYLVRKVLNVVKEVVFGHTVAVFWVNREKHQLVLDSYVTDSEHFASHRRREIGSDLISQVALTGHPRILNSVNVTGQSETLGYYQTAEPIKSFAAVPVFYPKNTVRPEDPVAVMAIDCLGEDAFGSETMLLLGDYAKLLSALIKSYTGKYDLLIDSEVLRSITRMRDQIRLEFSLHTIVRALGEETSRLVAWDYITVILFDESRKEWLIQFVMNRMNDAYVSVTQEIDPQHSLVGSVLQSGVPKIVENTGTIAIPRFYKAERVDSAGGAMVVPINSLTRCYGALVVESKDPKTYSESDVKVIQKLVETASWGFEVFNLTDVVNNFVLLDETTGVANRKYFMERMHEEVNRSNDFENDVTLVMISIDAINDHLSRYGKDGFDFVLQNVGRTIKSSVRSYDIVGRFDFNRFAVLLVNTTANDAYLWSEKFRKNIASNIINIEQKSFSVTVSVGVCGAVEDINDLELVENAGHVLTKAIEAGGNVVRVF